MKAANQEEDQAEPIVAAVEKETVLAMVDQMEAEAVMLVIVHDENESGWIEAIARWLQTATAGQVHLSSYVRV